MKKLLISVNVGWFFMSHRLPLAVSATAQGYQVHVATALDPELDKETESNLSKKGIVLHKLRLSRNGSRPWELAREFLELLRLYLSIRPDAVHLVTLKPVLLGGLAARIARVPAVVLAVPGRGFVFSARGFVAGLRRSVALAFYRLAYRRGKSRVIVQNQEDRDYFLSRGIFAREDVYLIRGSGVDLREFTPQAEPATEPVVVLASRMLKEKGIQDFVEAASILRQRGVRGRFALVGAPDEGNPLSHTRAELEQWSASGIVEWWGFRSDMKNVFRACHVVCLPTVYGEGVPKVLIEAAACGRPIVTTDMPGCRDIVRNELNGLLVEPRDVNGLALALERLLTEPALRKAMGARGRSLVEADFSLDSVVEQTLGIYRELLG